MLNELEKEALEMLLAGDHPALVTLRKQLDVFVVEDREFTGAGFFTDFHIPDGAVVTIDAKIHGVFGDVYADIDSHPHGVGFILFVKDGCMSMLEGYSYGDGWPPDAKVYNLRYMRDTRNLDGLEWD